MLSSQRSKSILLCITTHDNGDEEARSYPWENKDHETGEIYLTVFHDGFMHGTLEDFLRGYSTEIIKRFPDLELEHREVPDMEFTNPMLEKLKIEAKNSANIKPTKTYAFINPEKTFVRAFGARIFDHPEVTDYLCMHSDWEIKIVTLVDRKVID